MANLIDTEYTPIEGVHILSDSSYRKHVRTLPVLTCERCGKRNGQGGIDVRRCQGVRSQTNTPFSYLTFSHIVLVCRILLQGGQYFYKVPLGLRRCLQLTNNGSLAVF